MYRLERFESVKRYVKFFEWLNLILVSKDEPEEPSQIHNLRWIMKEQFLVPMRVSGVLHEYRHYFIVLVWVRVLIKGPSKFCITRR